MKKLTLGKNLTGLGGLIGVLGYIQTSGASEDIKVVASLGVAVLMAALAIAAQYGPQPK